MVISSCTQALRSAVCNWKEWLPTRGGKTPGAAWFDDQDTIKPVSKSRATTVQGGER